MLGGKGYVFCEIYGKRHLKIGIPKPVTAVALLGGKTPKVCTF